MFSERKGFATAAKELIKGDGCTGVPDFWWRECCDEHDRDYTDKKMTRAKADMKFYRCLRKKAKTIFGQWLIAPLYYVGVRLLAKSHWNSSQ